MKTVDIIERIEGEAKLVCSWKNGLIDDARIEFLNFRGFEYMLKGKTPLDALIYTPRMCGICGQAHLHATVDALEKVYENIGEKLKVTKKAKLLREIGLNLEIIDSHLKWFYMFIMPDICEFSNYKAEEYSPLKGSKWLKASGVVSETIKALAIFAGQWPHTSYMIPGGVISDPTHLDLITMQNYLDLSIKFFETDLAGIDIESFLSFSKEEDLSKLGKDLKDFVNISFKNNFHEIGKSYDNHITLGKSTLFKNGRNNKKTINKIFLSKIEESDDFTFKVKNEIKNGKEYSWSKNVKYLKEFYETGPLSRAIINDNKFIKDIHNNYVDSCFTRIMARMTEFAHLLYMTKKLIKDINLNEESFIKPRISLNDIEEASGTSVVEACRGSLYHKIAIKNGKIDYYDVITPTVWNLGPGEKGNYSVAQKAIIGTNDIKKAKIILRSFDICSVCTTH